MRAATLDTNSFTVDLIRGPSELGSVYSMIRSLEKKVEKNPIDLKIRNGRNVIPLLGLTLV